jgi:nicotinamide mononucleotide transporter
MSSITMDAPASFFIPRREQGMFANVLQGVVIGVVLTGLSYAVGLGFGWIDAISWLEVFAVFTSYVCTFLCVLERRINYPIGAVSTAAYCVLFWQFGLVASMAINAFLSVYLIYGWYRWKSDTDTRPVTRMGLWSWVITALVAASGYGIVVFLATSLGGTLAWTDSLILVGTIMAQFMLDNKKIENWGVWALVNVFAIYTYFHAGLALAGFQYIFFLLNTAYGFVMWQKSKRTQQHEELMESVGQALRGEGTVRVSASQPVS